MIGLIENLRQFEIEDAEKNWRDYRVALRDPQPDIGKVRKLLAKMERSLEQFESDLAIVRQAAEMEVEITKLPQVQAEASDALRKLNAAHETVKKSYDENRALVELATSQNGGSQYTLRTLKETRQNLNYLKSQHKHIFLED